MDLFMKFSESQSTKDERIGNSLCVCACMIIWTNKFCLSSIVPKKCLFIRFEFFIWRFLLSYIQREREREKGWFVIHFVTAMWFFIFRFEFLLFNFLEQMTLLVCMSSWIFFGLWLLHTNYILFSLLLSTMKWISSSSFFPQMSILLSDSNHIANFFCQILIFVTKKDLIY